MTGSMMIANNLGARTLLILKENEAVPIEALQDARARLLIEKANPSVRQGNVKFLTEWVRVVEDSIGVVTCGTADHGGNGGNALSPGGAFMGSASDPKKTPEQILKECQQESNALEQRKVLELRK
jgi:hypothetical protein